MALRSTSYLFIVSFLAVLLLPVITHGQSWQSLNEAAAKAYNAGLYDQALQLTREKITKAEEEFGTRHINYFTSIGDLASVLKKKGQYAESKTIEAENLKNIESALGAENLTYVTALKNLGNTSLELEEFQQAEHYYNEGNAVIGRIISRKDEYYNSNAVYVFDAYMNIGVSLGLLYQHMGRGTEARNMYLNLIDFCKSYLGDTDYYLYAVLINNLSNVYTSNGEYDKAEPYLQECRKLYEKWYGTSSPYYLQTTINLATVYKNTNRNAEAETLLLETRDILKQTQGPGSGDYITVLNNLGESYINLERYTQAERYLLEAIQWQEKNFGREHPMYQTLAHNLAGAYRWMNRFDEADKLYRVTVQKVLDDVENNFAYLTENEKRSFYVHQSVFISEYTNFALLRSGAVPLPGLPNEQFSKSSLGDLYNLQLNTKALLLNSTSKMKQNLLASGDSILISGFEKWELLKNEIARQYNLPKESRLNLDSLIRLSEFQESILNKRSAAFKRGFTNTPVTWQQVQQKLRPGEAAVELIRFYEGHVYVALIITPETKKHPQVALVKSSKTTDLEKGFLKFYKNAIRIKMADTISYNRFWKPVYDTLKKYSRNVNRIYLSPDGVFNEINLNTLQNPATRNYVIDETEIHLVTNTREVLELNSKRKKANQRAVLLGRPDYGVPDTTQAPVRAVFNDLQGTEKEVAEIAALLKKNSWTTKLLTGRQASESAVKHIRNPEILHLATHGFFVPPNRDQNPYAYLEAMLQSGIILASANHPVPGEEDGILTAYESMNLDLDSTQLVVLSACETGLGTIEAGEGVYGLQRTLTVAGAQRILMSLWKVDDTATQQLMSLFYAKWLQGIPVRTAFRSAQQELRKKYAEPYYWGAFVMVGK